MTRAPSHPRSIALLASMLLLAAAVAAVSLPPNSALAAAPELAPFDATPAVPSASLTPASLSFPSTTINTASEVATFTVQNNLGFDAQTAYIYGAGAGAEQTGVSFNDCTTVMNGNSCNFGLVFAPKAVGLLAGNEWVVLCSGPNGTGTCTATNNSALSGTGLDTDGSICPSGYSEGNVDAGTLQIHGCLMSVPRAGDVPLYFVTGSASLLGLHVVPSGAGHYDAPSFTDCTGSCRTAVEQFNTGPAAELVIDPDKKQIATNQDYTISWGLGADATELFDGHLNLLLGSGALLDLPVTPLTNLLGVPFTGRFQVFAAGGGAARVHINVGLPAVLGGLTGETDIGVAADGDISLNAINIKVGDAVIAGLRVRNLDIAYDGTRGYYHGAATLSLPTPKAVGVTMEVTILNNTLNQFAGGFTGLNLPLAQSGIYVQDLGLNVRLNPVVVAGNAAFTAGPMIKVAGTDVQAAKLAGTLKLEFPGIYVVNGHDVDVPYTRFGATGQLDLLGSQQLATAYLGVQSNGYIEAGGAIERKFGDWGKIKGSIKGEISGKGFNLEGRADIEVKYKITISAYGQAVVSSAGIAGCASTAGGWLSGGVGYKWGGSFSAFYGCDLGAYRVVVKPGEAQAAAVSPTTIRVPTGEREAGLEIVGADAPPDVKLIAPNGAVVETSSNDQTGALTGRFAVVRESDLKTTVIVLHRPVAGAWKLEVLPGSSPVRSVDEANGLAPAQASATVTGRGEFYRTLHWHLKTEPGQVVHFVELGAEDSHLLISTTQASGHLRFAIPDGVAGRREIQAQVQEAGLPRTDIVAGSYDAPAAPTPRRPTVLRLTRTGTTVQVSWERRGLIPTGYELQYREGDGQDTMMFLPGTDRSFDITTDRPTDRVSVSLAELDSDDVLGPVARRTLAEGM
jgi:hypothetical protein